MLLTIIGNFYVTKLKIEGIKVGFYGYASFNDTENKCGEEFQCNFDHHE